MAQESEIEQRVRTYILSEFLPDEDPARITTTTPLVSSGVLDSIATLRFVSYLEQEFSVSIDAHEVGADNFENIESITRLVVEKQKA